MKKVISVILALSLILINATFVFAASEKPDMTIVNNLLEEKYKGLETCIDHITFDFETSWDGDTFVIKAVCDYYLFNTIRFDNYTIEDKERATAEVRTFMSKLAREVTKLKPEVKFKGYYFSTFTNCFLDEREFRFCTWTGQDGKIKWLKDQDNEWSMSIPAENHIKKPKY
ncbi:MAG: hypothetical protein WC998_04575 [Candidatus Paceibacterota bacterium]|jgi:hypothetical protein